MRRDRAFSWWIASLAVALPGAAQAGSPTQTADRQSSGFAGYLKVGPTWIDVRRPPEGHSITRPTSQDANTVHAHASRGKLDADVTRELTTAWVIRIKAIRHAFLEPGETLNREKAWRTGRKRILEINDPLAIPALAHVLSRGGPRQRRLLARALTAFSQHEATQALLGLTLLDPAADVRRVAAIELQRRRDKSIVDGLRAALRTNQEQTIRRAATVLGMLKAKAAVPDLIEQLRRDHRVQVRVPRAPLMASLRQAFSIGTGLPIVANATVFVPTIGVTTAANAGESAWMEVSRPVTVYRTEVQEALEAITGQHLGFNVEAWRRWLRLHPHMIEPK